LAVSALALAMVAPPPAQAASRWFVELESAPTADGTSQVAVEAEHRRFAAGARTAGIDYRERYAYRTLFNGLSITADGEAAADIGSLDGVAAVYPVGTMTVEQTPPAFEPDLAFALSMTGADIAQSRLGLTGRGVHVAVLDSGIDYDHPDLGGCFGPGCRVTKGYDFVGDDYDEEEAHLTWQPLPHPDPLPDDCNGHGTHVAGIIGGNGRIRGVAPDVTFGAYRVIGCNGGASADVVLAGLERVYRDGADVLNLSIGESLNTWPDSPTARAASRLVDKGIVVVSAAGNDRRQGLYGTTSPGVGERVLAAASVENVKVAVTGFTISPDQRPIQYLAGTGSRPIPTEGTVELARTGTVTTVDDACAPLAPGSLEGKVALVRRGTCGFDVKGNNVAAAGAVALVVYSNLGLIDGAIVVTGVPIPAVYISRGDGELINTRLDEGPVQLTWGGLVGIPPNGAGRVSAFSGTGLAADLSLKPDLAAPGGLIRSTWPVEKGGTATLSGTSMAAPHVAGAAALYLQARPATRAGDLGAALLNHADPLGSSRVPADAGLEPVVRQGAGLVDVDDAVLATASVTPAKLSLRDSVGPGDPRRTLTIVNDGPRPITYALANVDAPAATHAVPVETLVPSTSAVGFEQYGRPVTTVTVRPGARARVDVRVAPDPALPDGALYGGFLVFTPDREGQPLRVPYAGYKGDYQAPPVMTPTANGYPWLARKPGIALDATFNVRPVWERVAAGTPFTFTPRTLTTTPPLPLVRPGRDLPYVLVHLERPAQRVRIDVFDARRGRHVGEALVAERLPRNAYDVPGAEPWSLVTALALDGTVRRGHRRVTLPDGAYFVRVTVERVLAERRTPVETWRSPAFRIDRP
jgi:subtilisin family serine protease